MNKKLISLIALMCVFISAHSVTFNVTVPDGTKACFIAGDFNGWDAGNAVQMKSSGQNTFTLTLDDVTESDVSNGYKYLCGQDWAYVEKGASGEELSNRISVGTMDVVASWAKLYNPDIIETKLVVNGYTRIVKILLPTDYDSSDKSYPVVYMTGVQSRYDNAGSDSDRGDDHMGDMSWNIPAIAKETNAECIFVSMYGFVAENIPYEYADFMGSGASDEFIKGIEETLIPYVNDNYRTLEGAENTSIAGADLGGLFSLYAALKRPDLFGQCAAISPLLWLNKEQIIDLANSTTTTTFDQRFYFSVGEKEPTEIKQDVEQIKNVVASRKNTDVRFTTFTGAYHNDENWGNAFKSIYPFLLSADASDVGSTVSAHSNLKKAQNIDFAQTDYSFLSAVDSQSLVYDKNVTFDYIDNYIYEGNEVNAKVAIIEIPADIKTKYYWNVTRSADGSGDMLKSENGNIGFSSKKTSTSWLRVVILEDETVKDIAANSTAFRVVTSENEVMMTPGDNHTTSATVNFGTDKTFKIYFGSVNSGSKQSSLTETLTVSENCNSANIVYDFVANKVTITENESGDNDDDDEPVTDLASTSYSIVSAVDSQSLKFDANSKFTYITDFISSEKPVAAQVTITEIPADIKSQYYWNVTRSADGSGDMLKSENGNIGFSSKKTSTSWHRVAILEGEIVKDVAANSTAFRLATADETITMTISANYKVKASANFNGTDKSFSIHYGSVNSGSDMGAITGNYTVSDNCIAADIEYDFFKNCVNITETKWGETIKDIVVDKFIAVPSVCNIGSDANVILEISEIGNNDIVLKVAHNYGSKTIKSAIKEADGKWSLPMNDLQAGIYHISLSLVNGENEIDDYRTIAIKVLNGIDEEKAILNPYKDIDWSTINQYKSNFHTHTTQSYDANLRVDETVDKYHQAGYQILALTEHDANPYPWQHFNLFNPVAESRNPFELDMLAIPGNELSKSYTNSWNEVGGSEFNHHNDFFTGRQGQEFATLRESYAYTEKLGGMQLINHPGQYWNLANKYNPGDKNSPEWHAENFMTYSSLIGLEVYNQGNRRPNDRILWDQILDITMVKNCNVWGYSCDDSHNTEQLFRNYNFMLMPELTIDALKDAMRNGTHYFSYEYSGSGLAKAPRINNISVDESLKTITIDTDASEIYWISSTDISDSSNPATRKSTIVGVGNKFDYNGFQGTYVRALIMNEFGETCTQPFGFTIANEIDETISASQSSICLYPNPASDYINIKSNYEIDSVRIFNLLGQCVGNFTGNDSNAMTINVSELSQGNYIVSVSVNNKIENVKLIIK